MTEKEFIDSIDCKFPYQDELEWQKTIELGCLISSNAAFAVLSIYRFHFRIFKKRQFCHYSGRYAVLTPVGRKCFSKKR